MLRDFGGDVFGKRDFIKWYGINAEAYPYNVPIDMIIGNLHNKKSDIYHGAKAIADKVFKRLVNLASTFPPDGEMNPNGDYCINHLGVATPVYLAHFPGNNLREVLPKESRRRIRQINNLWVIELLADVPMIDNGHRELNKIVVTIERLEKVVINRNTRILDVMGESETTIHKDVVGMFGDIQSLKLGPIETLLKTAVALKDSQGKYISELTDEARKLSESLNERDREIKRLTDEIDRMKANT
jgi:hypothetical protein